MAKKKTADVVNKKTEIEELYHDADVRTKPFTVEIGDKEFVITVKNHVSLDVRSIILSNVEDMFFDDGYFNEALGITLAKSFIFKAYSDADFGEDIDAFEKFDADYPVIDMFPKEAKDLYEQILFEADRLTAKYYIPAEEKKVFDKIAAVMDVLNAAVASFDGYLDKAKDSIKDDDVNINDLIDAVKSVSKMDSDKIMRAVMAMRAKREADADTATTKDEGAAGEKIISIKRDNVIHI